MNLPAIFIDVDGVLKLGHKPIPNAKKGIEIIQKLNIPFKIITNDGGDSEIEKAKKYSQILQLKQSFSPEDIILCHSLMKQQLKQFSIKDKIKLPLIVGQGNIDKLMKYYGVKKYITAEEYALIYHKMLPINIVKDIIHQREEAVDKVKKRLKVNTLFPPFSINGIFQISDVLRWEIPVQLCSDLLISTNGIPGTIKKKGDKFIPYHLSFDEIEYQDNFTLPRFSGGAFFKALQHLFKRTYNYNFPFTMYGKPSKLIFNYAKEKILKNYPDIPISNYYMIGDNPETDVKGANECGIYSILVGTGVFDCKKHKNDQKYPAKVVVKDIYDAISYILLRENII